MSRRRQLAIILAVVFLLRLPFLNQAVQGDDPYYLFGAEHALIDPAHPLHARYFFQGDLVDMRGHPHGPMNSLILGVLLAIFGDVYEVPFHSAYLLFSAMAGIAMWFLARRFTDRPLLATLLFLTVPAFVVNGNSFEADIPFLAFWTSGIALFVYGRLIPSAVVLAAAALTAYQGIVATPILAVYCWMHLRHSTRAWLTTLVPCVAVAGFQLYERTTGGALPAAVLAGYFSTYGLQQIANKLKNAVALVAHTGWMFAPFLTFWEFRNRWYVALAAAAVGVFIDPHPLFFIPFAVGALAIAGCFQRNLEFLRVWILLFFGAALCLFFAGSARYLLPMAPPLAILLARQRRLLIPAIAFNLVLGLGLAFTNYQHWDSYRQFAAVMAPQLKQKRVWVNGELGLRFYLEALGALPLPKGRALQPGELLVTSELTRYEDVNAPLGPASTSSVAPWLPFRLIGLGSKSGYSSVGFGLRAFDLSTKPVDIVRVDAVLERRPELSLLPMNSPQASTQIVSGVFGLEDNRWRWASDKAVLVLKPPPKPSPLQVVLTVPEAAPARRLRVLLDGRLIKEENFAGPGTYTLRSEPVTGSAVTLEFDQVFSAPGDKRRLAAILESVGFQ